jgi:hypothetical protein
LERGGEYLAIEVKAGERFATGWLGGLKAVVDLPGVVRRILVYTGNRELRMPDGIEVWPLPKFLAALAEGTLWP